MKKLLLNILFFFIAVLYSNAQNDYLIKNYSLDNKKNNTITCIYQTQDGILWLGTPEGLVFFDGYRFVDFPIANKNQKSIAPNYINSITEDDRHNLYIATENGILSGNEKKINLFI